MSSRHCALELSGSLWKEISLDALNLYRNEISSCSQKRRIQGRSFFENGKRFWLDKEERECILEKTISPRLQMIRVTAKHLRDQARCGNEFHLRCMKADTFSNRSASPASPHIFRSRNHVQNAHEWVESQKVTGLMCTGGEQRICILEETV